MRIIKGQLHQISRDYRLFSVQVVNKLEYFYLQPRFVKNFRKYLYPGVFIQFSVEDHKEKFRRRTVSKVLTFEQILGHRYHRYFSYFDQKIVKQNILNQLMRSPYRLFLDLEMTMQHSKTEAEEIIQAGAILVDQKDKILYEFDAFIRPTHIQNISKRTLDFLDVRASQIKRGKSYKTFYKVMKKITDHYEPAIIVWGTNDQYALEQSYTMNSVNPLFNPKHYIDLQSVLKQYYNLNYELGLFQTARIYGIDVGVQTHNAYSDAFVTREIFNQFFRYASEDIDFDFKGHLLETT